ncbi:Protein ChrB [Mycolicibacterium vanbaalenii]|uniref:Protein ChrB n=1 Tax=Mycolicibacterium vanbaalenii TaxID=110539 RepID=A0A5S9R3E6_MYCVN|nr:Protein ChrB [Mycolicibacterium vanbaalenii]
MLHTDGREFPQWLLLLAQLPASPSSARVALWRRARAAGAAGLHNGVWVLPESAAHRALFTQLAATVREHGSAFVLTVAADGHEVDGDIVARFDADRAREYDEFSERADEVLAEIAKETRREKFTFAELEEIEHDLDRLITWLAKITTRDFFPGARATAAAEAVQQCQQALSDFAQAVYRAEGLAAPDHDEHPEPDEEMNPQ